MLFDGRFEQPAVAVLVHRGDAGLKIEELGQLAPGADEIVTLDPAGRAHVVKVEERHHGHDGLQVGRLAGGGHELGDAQVGGPEHADLTVATGLLGQPLGDLVSVLGFLGRENAPNDAERSPGAAHVHGGQDVASLQQGHQVRGFQRAVDLAVDDGRPAVAGVRPNRGKGFRLDDPLAGRAQNVDGQADPVAHGEIERCAHPAVIGRRSGGFVVAEFRTDGRGRRGRRRGRRLAEKGSQAGGENQKDGQNQRTGRKAFHGGPPRRTGFILVEREGRVKMKAAAAAPPGALTFRHGPRMIRLSLGFRRGKEDQGRLFS